MIIQYRCKMGINQKKKNTAQHKQIKICRYQHYLCDQQLRSYLQTPVVCIQIEYIYSTIRRMYRRLMVSQCPDSLKSYHLWLVAYRQIDANEAQTQPSWSQERGQYKQSSPYPTPRHHHHYICFYYYYFCQCNYLSVILFPSGFNCWDHRGNSVESFRGIFP